MNQHATAGLLEPAPAMNGVTERESPVMPADAAAISWPAAERFAARLLEGPLTGLIACVCLAMLVTWIPYYLCWPWWPDLDAYAAMAQAWDAGELPYRDISAFNFPGQIYLFWILGKLFGWGRTVSIFALDVTLLLTLGAVLLAWSRRILGSLLPGLLGYAAFLNYYLGLTCSLVAQRDWHAGALAVLAILLVQGWGGRWAIRAAGALLGLACVFRPHVVLFLPVVGLSLLESGRTAGPGRPAPRRAVLEWGLAFSAFLALGFLPLIASGVFDDLIRGVRVAAYGGNYSRWSYQHFGEQLLNNLMTARIVGVALAVACWSAAGRSRVDRLARIWTLAVVIMLVYKPLHTRRFAYLNHPLYLAWAVDLALLARLVLGTATLGPLKKLGALLLLAGVAVPAPPAQCSPRQVLAVLRGLYHGDPLPRVDVLPRQGYSPGYPWDDYGAMVQYVRAHVPAQTRVANVLVARGSDNPMCQSLNGMVGRLNVFPVESGIIWAFSVRPDDLPKMVDALVRSTDSVVVWTPSLLDPKARARLGELITTTQKLYEPKISFGAVELWSRKAGSGQP